MDKTLTIMNIGEPTTQYDTAFLRDIPGLTWLPWVGELFLQRPANKRLLVVGESHYYKSQAEREKWQIISSRPRVMKPSRLGKTMQRPPL
jgi:hypothetical protein